MLPLVKQREKYLLPSIKSQGRQTTFTLTEANQEVATLSEVGKIQLSQHTHLTLQLIYSSNKYLRDQNRIGACLPRGTPTSSSWSMETVQSSRLLPGSTKHLHHENLSFGAKEYPKENFHPGDSVVLKNHLVTYTHTFPAL